MQFNIADIYNHADMLRLAQEILDKHSDIVVPDVVESIKQINI